MPRASRSASVIALLAGETGAVVTLHRLGRVTGFALPRHAIAAWLLHASTEDLFTVAARLVGLALAWWLLVATVFSLARRVVPGLRRLRVLDAVTPAMVRRTLDRAFAVGLGASLAFASLHAAGASPRARTDTPVVRTTPGPRTPPHVPPARPARQPAPPSTAPRRVVVHAGDNLWVIAHRALGGNATDADIAPYWQRVITANGATLRSHDPNLIFPGELVMLPPRDAPSPG